jgi:hypothetical protein
MPDCILPMGHGRKHRRDSEWKKEERERVNFLFRENLINIRIVSIHSFWCYFSNLPNHHYNNQLNKWKTRLRTGEKRDIY